MSKKKTDPPVQTETVEGPEAARNFSDLTKKLLGVSKKELDEARAKEEADR